MSRNCYNRYQAFLTTYDKFVISEEKVARKFKLVPDRSLDEADGVPSSHKRANTDSSATPSKRPKMPIVAHAESGADASGT